MADTCKASRRAVAGSLKAPVASTADTARGVLNGSGARVRQMKLAGAGVALLLGICAGPGMAQELLRNPGFESVPNSNQGPGLMPSEWVAITSSPDTFSNDGSYGLSPSADFPGQSAHSGQRFVAALAAPGTLEKFGQYLSAPLIPGNRYRLSAWMMLGPGVDKSGTGTYSLSLSSSPTGPSTLVGFLPYIAVVGSWQPREVEFVAPSTGSLLIFQPTQWSSPGTYPAIDDASLMSIGPSISSQPVSVFVCPSSTGGFSITAAGGGPITYQWRKSGIAIDPVTNPSASTNALSLANVQAIDAGTYDCVVTNPAGATISNGATLDVPSNCSTYSIDPAGTYLHTVNDPLARQPLVIDLATSGVLAGQPIRMQVLGDWGTTSSPRTATSAVFSSDNAVLADTSLVNRVPGAIAPSGVGSCAPVVSADTFFNNESTDIPQDFQVSGSCQLIVPPGANNLVVQALDNFYGDNTDQNGDYAIQVLACGAPVIATQPRSAAVCGGGPAQFSVAAANWAPFTYQWQLETAPNTWTTLGNDPLPLPCGQGAFAYAAPSDAPDTSIGIHPCPGVTRYQVRCVVSNGCGSTTSEEATFTLNSADFNGDGDLGTDADIEAFFACLAGNCCTTCGTADFNADGDVGTDADIEAFFRVLAGGSC